MPQKTWSKKDERQYEHVKQSEKKKGDPRAKEIAARTVNKQRSDEGRTKQQRQGGQRSSGGGNRLENRTRDQLYEQAKKRNIQGRSKMNKSQLVQALRKG